jgi:DNA mismatch endonuclease, patch repair protein
MDRLTVKQRSINMSHVRSKNTKPELYIFNALNLLKIKYKKHYKILGKPDVAFPDKKIAVFINGEFWHGRHFHQEKNNYKEFWVDKISKNMKRDKKNYRLLKNEGWKVIKIWDKDIKKQPKREIQKIIRAVESIPQ